MDGRFAVRLGFRLVAGLKNEDGAAVTAARGLAHHLPIVE